jgi:hypothetical protein
VELTLGVVRGFGQEPLLLLSNVTGKNTRCSLWQSVGGYLTRWLVEETIRFLKQSDRREDLRLLDYQRLRNPAAWELAAACFAAVWLGKSLKLAVVLGVQHQLQPPIKAVVFGTDHGGGWQRTHRHLLGVVQQLLYRRELRDVYISFFCIYFFLKGLRRPPPPQAIAPNPQNALGPT